MFDYYLALILNYFSYFNEKLHMGGYSFYIWSAYGVVAVCIAGQIFNLRRQRIRLKHKLNVG